ncbi:hypothetical protein HPB50_017708 [Hyalomma asiaticum]|uniref:Uncharacterized protein n=1 Tax=Hyalomma asiaticum TaxID=266040 RepID=A0ACB7SKT7_HYAAI|nr:hypothetical protein HPB50_017708 [Hyalomma asiaticum]
MTTNKQHGSTCDWLSADFMGLPCVTFYKAELHDATNETADRLWEKIASGNASDIGESDDERDVPLEEVLRENDGDMLSSSKDEDDNGRSPLKGISVKENVPKIFQWKRKLYVLQPDNDFNGHSECPADADETCTLYINSSEIPARVHFQSHSREH